MSAVETVDKQKVSECGLDCRDSEKVQRQQSQAVRTMTLVLINVTKHIKIWFYIGLTLDEILCECLLDEV